MGVKQRIFPVLPLYFADAVGFQILCYSICSNIGGGVVLEYGADCSSLFLIDLQLAVHETVAIGRKAAVPLALSGLLDTSLHGLDTDIFTLDFGHSGEDRNHQLSGVLGRINTVLHTDQIHTKILHNLQGGENIGGVSAKPREFEHQHKRYAIFPGFDVLHHLAELNTALNRLAGFACIFIFTNNLVVIELGKGFHPGFLGLQGVAVNLHRCGYSGVSVYF